MESLNKLSQEEIKLIEDNYGLILSAFNLYHCYDEDVQQFILYRICREIKLFDASKGKISTFIYAIIKNCIKEYNRYQTRKGRNLYIYSLDRLIYEDNDDSKLVDLIIDDNAYVENNLYLQNLEYNIKLIIDSLKTSDKNKQIFLDFIFSGTLEKDLGKKYNLSPQRINKIIMQIRHLIINKFKHNEQFRNLLLDSNYYSFIERYK